MTACPTIHILRHAHSSWAVPGQRDHQRALDKRGREDAARLENELRQRAFPIAQIVCSTALRARQTLEIVQPSLPRTASVRFSDDLYALGAPAYLAEIQAFRGVGDLLLIGHNPTIEQLVGDVCTMESEALRDARHGIGTANWLTIDLLSTASDGTPCGTLRMILKP